MVFHGGVWGKSTFDQKVDSLFAKSEFTFQHQNQPKMLKSVGGSPDRKFTFSLSLLPLPGTQGNDGRVREGTDYCEIICHECLH